MVAAFLLVKQENKFFSFVERFWFKKRSFFFYLSRISFLIGFALLAVSLLDLRGPEERIKATVPSKRTIVLIDTSASMLAEDVRPSRLEKAVLLAKHFARKAVGHQISVVVFSEIQKKIVPFTRDLDLIDSRLESIKGLKNQYGTSALSVAIQEAVQSFRSAGAEAQGNILVLTDGEETAEGIDLKIPEGVYVALVGIGTKNGGRIPLDDKRGMRYGYKRYKGKEVITKLNEEFFRSIVNKSPQTKYWLADTYSLPSEEIVTFFDAEFSQGIENQDMVIRPVFMQWLVVPGVIFLILSYFLKMTRVFIILTVFMLNPLAAKEVDEARTMPEKIVRGLEELQKGKLSREQKIGLASELQKNQFNEEALKLYQEEAQYLNPEERFNYGTTLLSSNKFAEGFSEYKKLLENDQLPEDLKQKIAQNSLLFLHQQEQQKKEQQKNKKDNKNDGSEDNSGESSTGQSSEPQNDQQSNQSNNENEEGDGQEKGDQENDQNKGQDDKKEDKQGNDADERPQHLPPKKLPAKLKQLMSDDRKLQMEMIERGTKDMNKRNSNSSKDW